MCEMKLQAKRFRFDEVLCAMNQTLDRIKPRNEQEEAALEIAVNLLCWLIRNRQAAEYFDNVDCFWSEADRLFREETA